MKLHSLAYMEFGGKSYAWTLDDLSLIEINLIVGKNSTGKSRVLRVINGLARLIDGTLPPGGIVSGSYKAVLKDTPTARKDLGPDYVYQIEIHEGKVQREILEVGGIEKLNRGENGRGRVYFEKIRDYIDVQIPEPQLASATRRDSQQHEYFEVLHDWAKSVRYYESARTEVNAFSAFEGKLNADAFGNSPLQSQLHLAVKIGKERFGHDLLSLVISDMRRIGYEITDFGLMPAIGVISPIGNSSSMQTLYLSENGIDKKLSQNEISDGMLRAFSTLLFLHFIRLQKKQGCFLIDDIGEGLDYDRSTKLIAVVIEQAEKGHLQLVMTTNDRFVMNGVPLKYWSVMQRNNGRVSVYNERNSADRFADFEEFGFNNFDFFAKQFFSAGVATT